MCGIAGLVDPAGRVGAPATALKGMGDAIAHRGPDGHGEWWDGDARVGLAHRRLAIIDLSAEGAQPMHSASGRYVVTFNGEIYNYRELREELAAGGGAPAWRGHSDTEVLLAAFEHWGVEGALSRANGMFALALWDRANRRLVLARDRFGEKPLYYGWSRGVFWFGSELKALRALPEFGRSTDPRAVAALLRFGYVPTPLSIHAEVAKLPQGSYLEVDPAAAPRDAAPRAYWSPLQVAATASRAPLQLTDAAAIDAVDAALERAVKLRMHADVPLGAFLSGGIDSTSVVAAMQRSSTRPVRTFSIGFREGAYNEADDARRVAEHLGTDHTELIVTPEEAQGVIPRLAAMYDEPFGDSSQIPTFLVSELARNHVTVALSGDGGDELFGGYNRHVWGPRIWRRLRRLPAAPRRAAYLALTRTPPAVWDAVGAIAGPVVPSLRHRGLSYKARKLGRVIAARSEAELYRTVASFWSEPPVTAAADASVGLMMNPDAWPTELPFAERMMAVDAAAFLPDDILVKVDRASMAVSLEARVPILDPVLFSLAWSLPPGMRVRDGVGKWVLRQALYKHVPRELIERPKAGFGVPVDVWLRGPLRPWAEELFGEAALSRSGMLQPTPIRQLWRRHLAGDVGHEHCLWTVLMLQAWFARA
jgi:asparagine synthase (glutamine-hydrolysing)